MMNLSSYLDATILDPKASSKEYEQLCEYAMKFNVAAICVPPFQVQYCKERILKSNVKLATVVGFPAGYQTIPTKILELREMISKGADEIDYVIHRGYLSNNDFENINLSRNQLTKIPSQFITFSQIKTKDKLSGNV